MAKGARDIGLWNLEPYGDTSPSPSPVDVMQGPLTAGPGPAGPAAVTPSNPAPAMQGPAAGGPATVGVMGTPPVAPPPAQQAGLPQRPVYQPPAPMTGPQKFGAIWMGQNPSTIQAQKLNAYETTYERQLDEWKRNVIAEITPENGFVTSEQSKAAANKLMQAGEYEMAENLFKQGDRLFAEQQSSDAEWLSIYRPTLQRNQETVERWEAIQEVTRNGTRKMETLSDSERVGLVVDYAKLLSPEALSNDEYARLKESGDLGPAWEIINRFVDVGARVPNNEILQNIYNAAQQRYTARAKSQNNLKARRPGIDIMSMPVSGGGYPNKPSTRESMTPANLGSFAGGETPWYLKGFENSKTQGVNIPRSRYRVDLRPEENPEAGPLTGGGGGY